MPLGPGKYDDWCTKVREETQAEGVILVVIGGEKGSGFSCQLTLEDLSGIPVVLRTIADEIEAGRGMTPK